jgi:hypothetical protein
MSDIELLVSEVRTRLIDLIYAPLGNNLMLWSAIPLAIGTLFIVLYFARHKREELGWNTAFGNTMVFLFVAMSILREMYYQEGTGSISNIFSNTLYFWIAACLIGTSLLLMFLTYFHLMPKRFAFFLLSAPTVNSIVYVVMCIVYASVPPDLITITAGLVFFAAILVTGRLIQIILGLLGLSIEVDLEERERVLKLADEVEAELESRKNNEALRSGAKRRAPPPSPRTSRGSGPS